MIEFVIALLVKRRTESRVSPILNDSKCTSKVKIGSKISKWPQLQDVRDLKNDMEMQDNPSKKYLGVQLKRALFNSVFAPTEQLDESMGEIGNENNLRRRNSITPSNKIDFTSALLFPIAYLIFNIIYWYCLI